MSIKIDKEKCTGCSACIEICPVGAIRIEECKAVISDECVECQACINICKAEAILLSE